MAEYEQGDNFQARLLQPTIVTVPYRTQGAVDGDQNLSSLVLHSDLRPSANDPQKNHFSITLQLVTAFKSLLPSLALPRLILPYTPIFLDLHPTKMAQKKANPDTFAFPIGLICSSLKSLSAYAATHCRDCFAPGSAGPALTAVLQKISPTHVHRLTRYHRSCRERKQNKES
ncbi:hypothetical protein BDP27DRAFT_1453409, partial [Rhodocollybia butyracea]